MELLDNNISSLREEKITVNSNELKVAFLTRKNPLDRRTWSGTFYSIFNKLANEYNVAWVKPTSRSVFSKMTLKLLSRWYKVVNAKSLNIINKFYARSSASSLMQEIGKIRPNIIFAAASPELVAYLRTDVPIIYFLDATFKQLALDYPAYNNLPRWNHNHGLEIEKLALDKSKHIIVSSEWAKQSICNDFNIDAGKVTVISYGANLLAIPTDEEVKEIIKRRMASNGPLKLLFIGKDWVRKGGRIVLDAFLLLNKEGISTQLTIIGSTPPQVPDIYSYLIHTIPYLDKNDEDDFKKLYSYFKEAHFIVLPTRADCTPIVFNEAAAFGLPVITTDTGGIKDVVEDKITGVIMPLSAGALEFAEIIKFSYFNKEFYENLSYQSKERYNNSLNWDKWLEETKKVINQNIT